MSTSFAITWDYRCPFARNAHEHVLTGLAAGADWDVTFVPFSLGQVHVAEGEPDVWDNPAKDTGLLALQAGTVVRDLDAAAFLRVHRALFAARHDEGLHIEDEAVVRAALTGTGVDADAVLARVADGSALEQVRKEHEAIVADASVWGVPTFVASGQSVFVRLMTRSPEDADAEQSITAIERVLDLVTGWPDLNEFKHTSIPR
jgi:protein-disulfide isomerase-like protein with CxxC motif